MRSLAALLLAVLFAHSGRGADEDPPLWLQDGKPIADTESRKSSSGFGAALIVTSDADWEKKWNTPAYEVPNLRTVSRLSRGDRAWILTLFANPQTDSEGGVDVTCDIRISRPNGKVTDDKGVTAYKGPLKGAANSQFLADTVIAFVGEDSDPLGDWVVEVTVHDLNRNAVVPLKTTFTLVGGGPRVGDTYKSVVAQKGRPSSEVDVERVRFLTYPDETIKFRDDMAVEIKQLAEKTAPREAPASAPNAGTAAPWDSSMPMSFEKDPIDTEIAKFRAQVHRSFTEDNFAELEQLSAQLVREKSRFGDGFWKIYHFHDALKLANSKSDDVWAAREARIERWEAQYPASIAARVVHIGFLTDYAWRARGSAYADKVKADAWGPFENRLAQAYILYQAALKFEERSPMLWYAGQTIALGQGWPVEEVMKSFAAAKASEPEFWHYDDEITYFLLPRWYGSDGDWERFAEAEMQRKDGLGAEGYARSVFDLRYYYQNIFKETRAQWPLVKQGFLLLHKKYPDSKVLLNEYAYLACVAEDRPSAREAFDEMNGQANSWVWSKVKIADYQEWVYRRP